MFPTFRRKACCPLVLVLLSTAGAPLRADESDKALLGRLESIRLLKADLEGGRFALNRADRAYEEAFRAYGIDLDKQTREKVVDRLRSSSIRTDLALALDDWAFVKRTEKDRRRLLELARVVDPDPWRSRLREAMEKADRKSLKKLAGEVEAAKQSPVSVVLLADALARAGETSDTVALLRKAQQNHPGDFWINHQLATALMKLRPAKSKEAIRFYTAALALRPQSPAVSYNLGVALRRDGALEEAEAAIHRAIKLQPKFQQAHLELASLLLAQGKLDESVAACRKAIALNPADPGAHLLLGGVLERLGKLDESVASIRKCIQVDAANARAHLALGQVLRGSGKLAEAVAAIREAIRLQPTLVGARAELGHILASQGKLDEAMACYREALRSDPPGRGWDAYLGLGKILLAKGKLEEALAIFRQTIRLRPDSSEAHLQVGITLMKLRRFDDAIAALKQAHRLGSKTANNLIKDAEREKAAGDK